MVRRKSILEPERDFIHPSQNVHVSTVTFADIRFGIETIDEASRRSALAEWLALEVRPMFERRVLDVTEDVMFKWRLLVEGAARRGIPIRNRT